MQLYRTAACLPLATAAAAAGNDFSKQVEEILARSALANADVGIDIRALESETQIYKHEETEALIPASNQKLLTSTVALSNLGIDFTYDTTVFGSSPIGENGVLDGDLWIVGSGDPSLTSERLADLAGDLKSTGLKKVTGNVYGDGTVFDDKVLGEGWSDDDLSFYYSPEIAGLNCDLNVISITVAPGEAEGDSPVITVNGLSTEEEQYVEMKSTVKTVGEDGKASASFERRKGTNTIDLSGSAPVGSDPASVTVTIHDPIAFTAYRLALALADAGIEVSSAPTKSGKVPEGAKKLAASTSAPLGELLSSFMKPSDNLYGEALLKTVARDANPDERASAEAGAEAFQAFLKKEGVDATGVNTVDGSGLSRQNTLTSKFLADLLTRNKNAFGAEEWKAYYDALPIGGVDGTIADRFKDSPAKGKVHAKTGSLTGVSSLSGYLEAGDDTVYAFSILMNGFESASDARQGQDDIVTALYSYKAE